MVCIKNKELNLLLQVTNPANKQDFEENFELIDFEKFIRLAVSNNLILLVYYCLKKNKKTPPDIILKLKQYYYSIIKRNLVFSNELIKIINLFNANNIQSLPFKGPVLSYFVYGSIFNRSFSDLDILICEKDLLQAYDLLIDFGFSPVYALNKKDLIEYSKTEHEMPFKKEGVGLVELHWELSSMYLNYPVKFEQINQYIINSTYENHDINNLIDEFLIVYLCIHGNKHQWDSIEQITSISWIIYKNKTLDWDEIFTIANKFRCVSMLLVGLNLTRKIYTIVFPAEVNKYFDNNPKANYLSDSIIKSKFDDKPKHDDQTKRFSSYHLYIKDSFFDKVRYLLRLIFMPTREDWNSFNLPKKYSFFYRILRPARLAIEFIKVKIKI